MKKKCIFVAHELEGLELITAALADYDLIVVQDASAAEARIGDAIDLYLIGIHFDDSRAVELVGSIRQVEKQSTVPIVMIRMLPSKVVDILRITATTLIRAGAISHYLELENDGEAEAKIRKAVSEALSADAHQAS
jgi:hypothetical protein